MDYNARLSISFYKNIATLSEPHKIYVVQNINSGKIFIKKILNIYNKNIYEFLKDNPIPYTPKIYEICEENNELTIIEEYISGDTIEQLINNNYRFDNDFIRSILQQLCVIISHLHNYSPAIIHRDIKPSNIIISPSKRIYLLDFNAAKYQNIHNMEDTALLGTKGYAAPEQYGFGVSTIQTDIYAIGMLLNTLVNGSFSPDPVLDSEFTEIIQKCTRLNKEERYDSVEDIIHILSRNPNKPAATKSLPKWVKFLPPGFQTLSPISMIFSGIGYFFLIWIATKIEISDASAKDLFMTRCSFLFFFITIVFCSTNYLNIQSYFPLCRTKNKILHFLAVVLLDIIMFVASVVLMALIVSF